MYVLGADEDVAHEDKIAVCLGLKKNELILSTDANKYYFSVFFEAILQWQG